MKPGGHTTFIFIGLLINVFAGFLVYFSRRRDSRNWRVARAPKLPIRLARANDDVWVRGEIVCPKVKYVPRFGNSCIHYNYKIEEYREVTKNNKKTNEWVTVLRDIETASFSLKQEDHEIEIASEDAEFYDLTNTGYDKESSTIRHSASFFPSEGSASAIGLVCDNGKRLEKHETVPLMVTGKTRDDFIEALEKGEQWIRRFASFFFWLGFTVFIYQMRVVYGPVSMGASGPEFWNAFFAASALSLIPLSVVWAWYTYNTLISYRHRTAAAWSQIDVDLKQRYVLIPKLVNVVKGYTSHEEEVFQTATRLKKTYEKEGIDQTIKQEKQAVKTVANLIALSESYPELKSDKLFSDLSDNIVALEDKIAHARHFYNENATEFNTLLDRFPNNILFKLSSFEPKLLFNAREVERISKRITVGS